MFSAVLHKPQYSSTPLTPVSAPLTLVQWCPINPCALSSNPRAFSSAPLTPVLSPLTDPGVAGEPAAVTTQAAPQRVRTDSEPDEPAVRGLRLPVHVRLAQDAHQLSVRRLPLLLQRRFQLLTIVIWFGSPFHTGLKNREYTLRCEKT